MRTRKRFSCIKQLFCFSFPWFSLILLFSYPGTFLSRASLTLLGSLCLLTRPFPLSPFSSLVRFLSAFFGKFPVLPKLIIYSILFPFPLHSYIAGQSYPLLRIYPPCHHTHQHLSTLINTDTYPSFISHHP